MNKEIRLGGHLKASEGLSLAVSTARGMRYNEMQIMVGPDRDYKPWDLDEETCLEFQKMSYGITVTVHLPYVINPCESSPQRVGFYKRSLRDYLKASHSLGARRLVLHPGYKKLLSEGQAYDNLLKFLDDIWEPDYTAQLLLETDSGSKNGSAIGSPEFIEAAIRDLNIPNVGMCLDTTHVFARGINIWDESVRGEFLDKYGNYIGLIHMNCPDKEVTLGSFRDRHNTPFQDRKDLKHSGMIKDLAEWPMILERRSIQVQKQDNVYIRELLGQPYEKQRA